MHQVKLSLSEDQVEFLGHHRDYGFRDRSELVRTALERFRKAIERRELKVSASLYCEVYEEESDSKLWVEDSLTDWPI